MYLYIISHLIILGMRPSEEKCETENTSLRLYFLSICHRSSNHIFQTLFQCFIDLIFNNGYSSDVDVVDDSTNNLLSAFKKQAHPASKGKDVNDFATTKGFKLAMAIVLLNCDELAELNNELFSNLIMSVLL